MNFGKYSPICVVNTRRRRRIGPLDRWGHFFSRRSAPKTQHKIVMKRSNLLKQSCVIAMRESHPPEYNAILKEIVELLPDGAVPRYAEIE